MDDREYIRIEKALKPLLTQQFLDTLVEAVRVVGNGVDSVESKYFAINCFNMAGKNVPMDELDDLYENLTPEEVDAVVKRLDAMTFHHYVTVHHGQWCSGQLPCS